MDHEVVQFRRAAARENRDRRGGHRRYSARLQQQAVAYWTARATLVMAFKRWRARWAARVRRCGAGWPVQASGPCRLTRRRR